MWLILFYIFVVVASFAAMEIIAWTLHKYVMHGFMWKVHKDHHEKEKTLFERNDFFAIIFGLPSWLLIMFGIMAGCDYRLYMGIGITLYGICYVLVHDGLIHKRIKVFQNTKNRYLIALRDAHNAHHKHDGKHNYNKDTDICYGMLWVPKRFYKNAKTN